MELVKYYEVFSARAKVALEAGVDLSSESLVSLKYCESRKKDASLPERPVWRGWLVKIEPSLKEVELMKIIMWDTQC